MTAGIIEKAHEGKGLGHRFLRHIERNAVLLFLIPADEDNIKEKYQILLQELEAYNKQLIHKPRLLVITKSDMIDEEMESWIRPELPDDLPVMFISAVSGKGLVELKDRLWTMINEAREEEE